MRFNQHSAGLAKTEICLVLPFKRPTDMQISSCAREADSRAGIDALVAAQTQMLTSTELLKARHRAGKALLSVARSVAHATGRIAGIDTEFLKNAMGNGTATDYAAVRNARTGQDGRAGP
jgi:hypothetical protein